MFIKNCWYAAALSHEVQTGLFPRVIAGEKVVFYRKEDGEVVALEDRCAHRQVPLSKGVLQGNVLRCWYHGLEYDSSGACTKIPSQNFVPPRACVRKFAAVERYGFIWIWPGEKSLADPALIPNHEVCASAHLPGEMSYCAVKCNYLFGIDNILDISHAAFVHGDTLGSLSVAENAPEISITESEIRLMRRLNGEPAPPMYRAVMGLDTIDRTQEVIFWPIGNTRVETVAFPHGRRDGTPLRAYTTTIFTPASFGETHVFVGMHRDFAVQSRELTDNITRKIRSTVDEDRDVAEALQNNWDPMASMIDIVLDAPAAAARKMLSKLIEREDPTLKDVTLLRPRAAKDGAAPASSLGPKPSHQLEGQA